MKPHPVMGDDAGGFLTPMLQSVQAKGGNGGGIGDIPDPENTAFFVWPVIVDQISGPALRCTI
jgi:hypothetical protein